MQERAKFIQLFRYEPTDPEHDSFERVIINTKHINLVEWHEDWDFVAIVCKTDHPEGTESFIEDYGDSIEARKRYMNLLTLLGANDGTAIDREKRMKKTMKEHAKTDAWFRGLIQKAKAAGYDPFGEDDEDPENHDEDDGKECGGSCEGCDGQRCDNQTDGDQAEVTENGCDTPAEPEGHMG